MNYVFKPRWQEKTSEKAPVSKNNGNKITKDRVLPTPGKDPRMADDKPASKRLTDIFILL